MALSPTKALGQQLDGLRRELNEHAGRVQGLEYGRLEPERLRAETANQHGQLREDLTKQRDVVAHHRDECVAFRSKAETDLGYIKKAGAVVLSLALGSGLGAIWTASAINTTVHQVSERIGKLEESNRTLVERVIRLDAKAGPAKMSEGPNASR